MEQINALVIILTVYGHRRLKYRKERPLEPKTKLFKYTTKQVTSISFDECF